MIAEMGGKVTLAGDKRRKNYSTAAQEIRVKEIVMK